MTLARSLIRAACALLLVLAFHFATKFADAALIGGLRRLALLSLLRICVNCQDHSRDH